VHKTAEQLGKDGSGLPYSGSLATYSAGGFVRELRAKTFKTVHYNIDELYENAWIDLGTRAVFLELAVYNPHLLIFCAVKYALSGMWYRRHGLALKTKILVLRLSIVVFRGGSSPKIPGGLSASARSSPSPFSPFTETEKNTNFI